MRRAGIPSITDGRNHPGRAQTVRRIRSGGRGGASRVGCGRADRVSTEYQRISEVFYERILAHEGARKALEGGESQVGHLKHTLVEWMGQLFRGPWDEPYFEMRERIGRKHVAIALPQHY